MSRTVPSHDSSACRELTSGAARRRPTPGALPTSTCPRPSSMTWFRPFPRWTTNWAEAALIAPPLDAIKERLSLRKNTSLLRSARCAKQVLLLRCDGRGVGVRPRGGRSPLAGRHHGGIPALEGRARSHRRPRLAHTTSIDPTPGGPAFRGVPGEGQEAVAPTHLLYQDPVDPAAVQQLSCRPLPVASPSAPHGGHAR